MQVLEEAALFDLICEALELPAGSVNAETRVDSIGEWDSLGWLNILSLLEERYGVMLEAQEIRRIATAGELYDLVVRRLPV